MTEPEISSEVLCFNRMGMVVMQPLGNAEIAEALAFLKSRPVHPGCHVRYAADAPVSWDAALGAKVLCWHHRDVLAAPHLLRHALTFSAIAAEIIGRDPPLLYSVNVFCTRPDGPMRPDIQDWHRDMDDSKFVPLFINLTDGNAQEVRLDDGQVTHIACPAGAAFFSNTMLAHRGIIPTQERILFWARWGVSDPPPAYQWDQLFPIPASEIGENYPDNRWLRDSLRLLVTP